MAQDSAERWASVLSRVRGSLTNSNKVLDWMYWHFFTIITAHNQWLSTTRSIPYWITSVFSSTVTDLVLIYESVTSSASVIRWLTLHSWTLNYWIILTTTIRKTNAERRFTCESSQSQSHIATDDPSVSLGVEPHLGLMTRYLLLFDSYGVVFCGAPSLTRGRVCLLYMLLVLASAVFLGSKSLGTRDHILLSQIWDFPFRRLLRLAGSRWKASLANELN
jgi:hypothetical protein